MRIAHIKRAKKSSRAKSHTTGGGKRKAHNISKKRAGMRG